MTLYDIDRLVERIDAEHRPEPRRPRSTIGDLVLGAVVYAGLVAIGWWMGRR